MTDSELDIVYNIVLDGFRAVRQQSEIGIGGRARHLYRELAKELEDLGILDELKALVTHIEEEPGKRHSRLSSGGIDDAMARLNRRAVYEPKRKAELEHIRQLDQYYRHMQPHVELEQKSDFSQFDISPGQDPRSWAQEQGDAERVLTSALEVWLLTLPGEMTSTTGQALLKKVKTTDELIALLVEEEEVADKCFMPAWW